MSYSARSNMCPCLLLLAFSLANLGDSYSPAWERAEQPGERVRRGGPEVQPMHTALARIIFMPFKTKTPVQKLRKLTLSISIAGSTSGGWWSLSQPPWEIPEQRARKTYIRSDFGTLILIEWSGSSKLDSTSEDRHVANSQIAPCLRPQGFMSSPPVMVSLKQGRDSGPWLLSSAPEAIALSVTLCHQVVNLLCAFRGWMLQNQWVFRECQWNCLISWLWPAPHLPSPSSTSPYSSVIKGISRPNVHPLAPNSDTLARASTMSFSSVRLKAESDFSHLQVGRFFHWSACLRILFSQYLESFPIFF